MSAKSAWRVCAWTSLAMSASVVSMGACSSTHDNGNDAGSSSTSNNSSSTASSSKASTTTTSEGGGGGQCSLPTNTAGLLYNGGVPNPSCPTSVPFMGVTNYWFSYFDSTAAGTADAAAFDFVHTGDMPGCDGAQDCAYHVSGMNMPGYGAGVGFTVNNNATLDVSTYTGFQVWLKGTTTGTRSAGGPNYPAGDNFVHVKFVTGVPNSDAGDPRNGDDFGAYCPTQSGDAANPWVLCKLTFTGLQRDGFSGVDSGAPDPGTDVFDPQNLVKIQFEISSFTPQADSGVTQQVSFDFWIDDASFY